MQLQRPVQVQVLFARDFLWQRVLLAQIAVRVFVRDELDCNALGAGSPRAGPVWQNSGAWRRACRTWAQQEMQLNRSALLDPRNRGANAQQGLRFRRRVLSGYLCGVVWGEQDEPPLCAEERAEQAAAEAAAAVAAALAAAQLAAQLAAEARRARVRSVVFLAEAIAWRWRRWRQRQRAVVDPRSPPLVPPPQQRLADPDSPWGQLDDVPVRDLAVCKFRTYESIPRDLRARMSKALGDVLRRLFAYPADLLDPACASRSARERSRALKWMLGFWQLFLRRVTTNRGRRRRPIERRLTQWENRDFASLVAEWRTDWEHQPAPKPREGRDLESQVRSAAVLIEEGEISRGVRFLHSAAQGLGVAGLDEAGVLEQLQLKHPRRRTPVRSFSHYGVPRSGPLDLGDVVERKGRKLRRRLGVGADGGRNEHIRAVLAAHGDMDADGTGDLLTQFAGEWAGGLLPRWYYAHSLASRLVALEKKKVGRRELKPVRPIGVGSAVHRLICSAVVEHAKAVFLRLLAPIQVAVNVKAAAEKLVFACVRFRASTPPRRGFARSISSTPSMSLIATR